MVNNGGVSARREREVRRHALADGVDLPVEVAQALQGQVGLQAALRAQVLRKQVHPHRAERRVLAVAEGRWKCAIGRSFVITGQLDWAFNSPIRDRMVSCMEA